jgi:hypothetical protein
LDDDDQIVKLPDPPILQPTLYRIIVNGEDEEQVLVVVLFSHGLNCVILINTFFLFQCGEPGVFSSSRMASTTTFESLVDLPPVARKTYLATQQKKKHD